MVKGLAGISGSNTVSKCPIKKSFFPLLVLALASAEGLNPMLATKCPALRKESGIGIHLVVKFAFSNSLAKIAPTFFTPSIFKVPLLISTDSFKSAMALGILASIYAIIFCSSLFKVALAFVV